MDRISQAWVFSGEGATLPSAVFGDRALALGGVFYVQTLATSPDNKHAAAIPGSAGQDLQVFRLPNPER